MFTHGVASFDPTAEGVLLWTRCVDPAPVRWHLEPVEPTDGRRRSGEVRPHVLHDWCVTVDVTDLAPATSYRYWFEAADGTTSMQGRTRTLPAAGVEELRMAVVCCSDLTMGWFRAFRAIAATEVDLVLHLGDAIYEETKGDVRDLPEGPSGAAVTLADYRSRHAATRADPDLQALHARHPMIFVWDDHDVADNAWRHGAKAHDPEEHGAWEPRLAAAAQARQDWMPARLVDPDDLLDMHRSVRIGDLVDLVVLDTRIPGRDEQPDESGATHLEDPARTMLGLEQRSWALDRLADPTCTWTVVASAVTLSPLGLPISDDDVPTLDSAVPSGYAIVGGEAICTDEWDGYPAERRQLIDAMASRGGGTVIVSGDVHSSWALEVQDVADRSVAAEVVCPSITSTPMGRQLPKGWEGLAEELADQVPPRRWCDLVANGWLHLTVSRSQVQADWWRVDPGEQTVGPDGASPHLDRGDECLASWALRSSDPTRFAPVGGPVPATPERGGASAWMPLPEPEAPGRVAAAAARVAEVVGGVADAFGEGRGPRPGTMAP